MCGSARAHRWGRGSWIKEHWGCWLTHSLVAPCSLGIALTDALDELIGEERIDPQLAMKVLTQFDRVIAETLQEKVKARLTFKVISFHLHLDRGAASGCFWCRGRNKNSTGGQGKRTEMLTRASPSLRTQGSLDTYRFCDEVWTFLIRNVAFKLDNGGQTINADKVKIVSCSSKKNDEK
jgi:transcription initiation factor TFIIA small subunit